MGQAVNDEKWGQRREKKRNSLHLDSPRSLTNDQQGFMIKHNLRKQYSVFYAPFFKGTKTKHPKTAHELCGTDLNEGSGTAYNRLHCDLRWKYEDTLKLTEKATSLCED